MKHLIDIFEGILDDDFDIDDDDILVNRILSVFDNYNGALHGSYNALHRTFKELVPTYSTLKIPSGVTSGTVLRLLDMEEMVILNVMTMTSNYGSKIELILSKRFGPRFVISSNNIAKFEGHRAQKSTYEVCFRTPNKNLFNKLYASIKDRSNTSITGVPLKF